MASFLQFEREVGNRNVDVHHARGAARADEADQGGHGCEGKRRLARGGLPGWGGQQRGPEPRERCRKQQGEVAHQGQNEEG